MLTPVALAEHLANVTGKEIAKGRGTGPSRISAFDSRSLHYAVAWLADGSYAWPRPEHEDARRTMTANADLPPDGSPTPEARYRDGLVRLLAAIRDEGLDHHEPTMTNAELIELCATVTSLSNGTYPWRLSAGALEIRALAEQETLPAPR